MRACVCVCVRANSHGFVDVGGGFGQIVDDDVRVLHLLALALPIGHEALQTVQPCGTENSVSRDWRPVVVK